MTSRPLFIIEAEIDRDLLAHAPIRMFQRLRQRRLLDVGGGPGAERPAGRRDDHALKFLAIARGERLKQRVVLGIGGQDAGPRLGGALHEEIAGANQTLLVGERDGRAAIDRGERGLQPRRTADRRHHPVGGTRGGLDDGAFAGAAFDAGAGKCGPQFAEARGIGDRGKSRAELLCEVGQCCDVGIRRQRLDLVAVARAAQQIHRAVTDRSGGAEHRNGAHVGKGGLVVTQWNCAHSFTKP